MRSIIKNLRDRYTTCLRPYQPPSHCNLPPQSTENDATPYAFAYSIFDENTGLTHSRHEEGDDEGGVTGFYEVLEPDCTVRKVTYRADKDHGFDVLNIERTPCSPQQRAGLEAKGQGKQQQVQNYSATFGKGLGDEHEFCVRGTVQCHWGFRLCRNSWHILIAS